MAYVWYTERYTALVLEHFYYLYEYEWLLRWFQMVEWAVQLMVFTSEHIAVVGADDRELFPKLLFLLTHNNILHQHTHCLEGNTKAREWNFHTATLLYSHTVGFVTAITMDLSCCKHSSCIDPLTYTFWICTMLQTVNNSSASIWSLSYMTLS